MDYGVFPGLVQLLLLCRSGLSDFAGVLRQFLFWPERFQLGREESGIRRRMGRMKRLPAWIVVLVCLAGGSSQAALVTSEQFLLLNAFIPDFAPFFYYHEMTHPTTGPAIDPPNDTLREIQLHLVTGVNYLDLTIFLDPNITLDTLDFGTVTLPEYTAGFSYVRSTAILNVTLVPLIPDFTVSSSTLSITFEQDDTQHGGGANGTPEPATLTLFGIGALAAAIAGRRRA
jgi:hypothetical protein